MKKHVAHPNTDPYKFPAQVFRLAFGILFLFVGIKKFRMGIGEFAESLVTADTNMVKEFPHILLMAYGYILPFVQVGAGILLIINKYTFLAFQTLAVIYLTFIFGQMYNENTAKIGTEYLPSMIALIGAYYFNYKYEEEKLNK